MNVYIITAQQPELGTYTLYIRAKSIEGARKQMERAIRKHDRTVCIVSIEAA